MAFSSHPQPIVSLVVRPETRSAWIRLAGDADLAAEPALTEAVNRLHGLTLQFIVVDLTAATFACSTLANFLATLHRAHPDAELALHHPSPLARIIVIVTGLDACVVMSSDPALPATLAPERMPPASAARLTTATLPLNTRYPGCGAGIPGSEPGRWETIDRQPGRGLNRR